MSCFTKFYLQIFIAKVLGFLVPHFKMKVLDPSLISSIPNEVSDIVVGYYNSYNYFATETHTNYLGQATTVLMQDLGDYR